MSLIDRRTTPAYSFCSSTGYSSKALEKYICRHGKPGMVHAYGRKSGWSRNSRAVECYTCRMTGVWANVFCKSVVDLYIIAENLVSDLIQANIGQLPGCPVVLVGHSVGGLVIKQVCCQAHEKLSTTQGSDKDKLQRFLNNIHGIFFYSTPHRGSPIAEEAVDVCGGPLRDYFRILSTSAARLNDKFDRLRRTYPKLQIEGVGESLPTRLGNSGRDVFIVPEASSRQGDFEVVDEVDHFTITRPITKTKRSYYKLEHFLSKIIVNMQQERETNQGLSTVVHNNDNKYVPIEKSQTAVIQAIEDPGGPPMILLHGGVGKGKSTLLDTCVSATGNLEKGQISLIM